MSISTALAVSADGGALVTTRAVVAGDVLLSAPRSLLLSSDGALAGDLSFVAKCSRGSGACRKPRLHAADRLPTTRLAAVYGS